MVGKGQFNMLTRILNGSQIHIVPRWSTRLNLSALVPIEGYKILAQARTSSSIHHIQTKTNWLVCIYLHIEVSRIYLIVCTLKTSKLFQQFTQNVWSQHTKRYACRQWNRDLGTGSILTIRHHTDGNMGT